MVLVWENWEEKAFYLHLEILQGSAMQLFLYHLIQPGISSACFLHLEGLSHKCYPYYDLIIMGLWWPFWQHVIMRTGEEWETWGIFVWNLISQLDFPASIQKKENVHLHLKINFCEVSLHISWMKPGPTVPAKGTILSIYRRRKKTIKILRQSKKASW